MNPDASTPSETEIKAALERLFAWPGLAASKRSKGVLTYLCNEVLQQRGDEIRAKTIALDHYGYTAEELTDRESVVRVDIGRLRRRLDEYYNGPGLDDPLRISLPKGSYAPEICYCPATSLLESSSSKSKPRHLNLIPLGFLIFASIVAVAIGFSLPNDDPIETSSDEGREMVERSAVFDVSPTRLQAMNLADDGRDLVFPAIEPARVKAALGVFDATVETDPTYFGGHAGRAQALAILALLSPDEKNARQFLSSAGTASTRALELAPDEAWSQSARGWLEFVKGNYQAALTFSNRAVKLAPDDPHIVEFDTLISLFSGEFDRVISETERILQTLDKDTGFVFTNALGSAKFHSGDYNASVIAFEDSIRRGGPVGPFTLSYMMAAKYRLGLTTEASELAQRFREGWPDHPIDRLVQKLFANHEHAADLVQAMSDAGWNN